MFNDWIDISVLARAYELNCKECLELARQVKVKLGPVTIGKVEGPSDIEIYSRRWTEGILQEGIGEKKIHSINMMVKIINSSWWKGPIPDFEATGKRNFDFLNLYAISRLFLVLDLSVNKKEAIQVLYLHDYILKNECNGLTVRTIQAMQNGESSLTAKDVELEQARAELSALREENAALKAALEQARQQESQGMRWYGLIAVVEQARKAGLTPQETAASLKAAGASYAVIAGLLHPEGDIKDWLQYGKNLLTGMVKEKLPW